MSDREPPSLPTPAHGRAFAVHIFTASGAALGLGALVAAVHGQWALMFLFLGIALAVDGIDGTMARKAKVAELLPRWSGDVLDLVVDFVNYVFVPAYALATSGLLPDPFDLPAGMLIVMTSALYFSDRAMKTEDNYFRGFPALWNVAAFYLFLLKPSPWIALGTIVLLAVLTFVPFKFIHPFRVVRLRRLNLSVVIAGSVLALVALLSNLEPGPVVTSALVAAAVYFIAIGLTDRTGTS